MRRCPSEMRMTCAKRAGKTGPENQQWNVFAMAMPDITDERKNTQMWVRKRRGFPRPFCASLPTQWFDKAAKHMLSMMNYFYDNN
ncbi:hypothetical protein CYR40_05075 [Chimaeribacter arupi]|nr:hypothetical protein CYR40_05075 [Chimaeribacter arupi]